MEGGEQRRASSRLRQLRLIGEYVATIALMAHRGDVKPPLISKPRGRDGERRSGSRSVIIRRNARVRGGLN